MQQYTEDSLPQADINLFIRFVSPVGTNILDSLGIVGVSQLDKKDIQVKCINAWDNDLPDFLDYTMRNRTYRYFRGEALFPFGYGLSYTTFDISKPVYRNNKVRVTVKNTGKCDGTEVVQVYMRNTADKEGPLKSLRAYSRVTLKAGESRVVDIDFPRQRFEGWDAKTNTIRVVPGRYELMVGASSADKDLKKIMVNVK